MVQVIAVSDMLPGREMCDDAREQTGTWRRTADANVVRAGLAIVIMMTFLKGTARAQLCTAEGDEPLEILLHPGASTTVQLPEEILDARIRHRGEFLFEAVGHDLNLRPLPGTPAGTEALVQVETGTLYRTFRLRVVERVEDAQREVVVSPVAAVERAGAAAAPAIPATEPAVAEPAASAPASAPGPSEPSAPEPARPEGGVTTEPAGAAAADRDAAAAGSLRFEISVHAVAALAGTTEITLAGLEGKDARQSHRAFSMRVAVAPPDAWWSVEASVGGEQLAAPTTHGNDREDSPRADVAVVSGPLLRADAGMRARLGTRFSPTVYAGGGFQARHRDIEHTTKRPIDEPSPQDDTTRDMPFRGVLALGMGLEYRAGNLLLGVELHVRQGVPADYRSVSWLVSVGFVLDQGE